MDKNCFKLNLVFLVDHVDEEGGQEVDQQDADGAPAQLRCHLRHSFATVKLN